MTETTVAMLIEHLQTLPQDAIVEVMRSYEGSYTTETEYANVNITETDVYDFTDEKWKHSRLFGHVVVELKSSDR